MALRLQSMTNVTAPGGNYPYGNVKDDDGTGNGTPVNKADFADMFQFFARLLALGGVVGNDLPENSANTFQYHTALQNIINSSVVGFLQLKGGIDCSGNPNYPAASKGWSYVVTVAGKIGGGSGVTVAVGDYIICSADNAGGTQGAVGTSWFVVERNLDLATSSVAGIAKLYANLSASNTDGAPDQSSVVAGIAAAAATALSNLNDGNVAWIAASGLSYAGSAWASSTGFYKKTLRNTVKMTGLFTRTGGAVGLDLIATLPGGYIPSKIFVRVCGSQSTLTQNHFRVEVRTDGTIYIDGDGGTYATSINLDLEFEL
jgi:hypothetical protein